MNFETEQLYHIYNRGNNKQKIFFTRENYLFFLSKTRKQLLPRFDILAYCLMPNHFHFLVFARIDIDNEKAIRSMATLLSSYTRAINIQEKTTGSLFQQKTKTKPLLFENTGQITPSRLTSKTTSNNYPFICLNYIHQNPKIAGLGSFPHLGIMQNLEMELYAIKKDVKNYWMLNSAKNFMKSHIR